MQKTKYLIFVLSMMLFAHTLMGQKESIERRNTEYQRALELFEKNKYSSAQKAFKEFLKNTDEVFNDEYLVDAYYYDAVCSQMLTNNDAESKLVSLWINFRKVLDLVWYSFIWLIIIMPKRIIKKHWHNIEK